MQLQRNLADYERYARVVAVSPITPQDSRNLVRDLGLRFDVLSDPGAEVAAAFGLAYVDPVQGRIPRPTVVVLDSAGRVLWSKVATSLTDRARAGEVLEVLQTSP